MGRRVPTKILFPPHRLEEQNRNGLKYCQCVPYNSRDDERWNETWEEEGEGVESLLTGVHGTLSK